MKKSLLLITLLVSSTVVISQNREDLLTYSSKYSVSETSTRLVDTLKEKGFTIFKTVDHSLGAKNVGIELHDTTVVIFGNPKIGSKLMQCAPTVAIDLPQKALIWKDTDSKVWLAFNNPDYLKQRHNVKGCDQFFGKIKNAFKLISNKVTM